MRYETLLTVIVLLSWGCAICAWGVGEPAFPAQIPALNWEPRSDWVSVKGPGGAVGDGVADDTAAIQQVLSAAKSGTTIYFPPGAYRVTRTLELRGAPGSGGRLMGVQVIGHGRDTQLVWDGNAGEKLWIDDGVTQSRYAGLLFDGRNKAAVGFYHENIGYHFETNLRNQHLAFLNFTVAGVLTSPPGTGPATAEITYENCLFENCGRGVSISKYNDYDFTIEGCEFRRCGIGVYCFHGNFYVRDCRFEGSREADISATPAHGCSIRRCTSVGSFMFLKYEEPVAPLTVEDCHVAGWKNPEGAIRYGGAPLLMFDCVFHQPPGDNPPVNITRADQMLVLSENKAIGMKQVLRADPKARVFMIPAGKRSGGVRSAQTRFLKSTVRLPGKVFDAKRDFGAIGNARTDDTAAIQQCIDAARAHGRGAIAYLPTGVYIISRTLTITGKDYTVGGAGFSSMLYWRGADGGVMVAVHDPQNVTLENLNVGNHDIFPFISGIPMKNGIDILQTGSDQSSKMEYNGVWVFGKYQKQPDRKGLVCRGLGAKAVVRLNGVEGNLRFTDCAAATILANTTYEGSVTVDGKDPRRTGLLGFMTRLGTVVSHGLYLRDNQNIVMSDFYIEQADGGCVFEGGPGLPAGRATIGNHKFHFGADGNPEWIPGDPLTIHNYAGEIFWGPSKPREGRAKTWRIVHTGDQPVTLWLYVSCFYISPTPSPELQASATLYMMAVERVVPNTVTPVPLEMATAYAPPPDKLAQLSSALDDLRRLGEMDMTLNHASQILIVGDSTVADYPAGSALRGWGQLLPRFLNAGMTVLNLAVSGRSTKTFMQEKRWEETLKRCQAGDTVLIQFGHNDSHEKGKPESTNAATEYRDYLRQYVDDVRCIGATPILVTPMHRRLFDAQGRLTQELAPYAEGMKVVAAEKQVDLVDLYSRSGQAMQELGDAGCADLFCSPEDRTHFSEKGALFMAQLVAEGLAELPATASSR